jgi:hypothetical protein
MPVPPPELVMGDIAGVDGGAVRANNRGFLLGVDKDPALTLVIPLLHYPEVDVEFGGEIVGEAHAHPRRDTVMSQDGASKRGCVAAATDEAALRRPRDSERTRIELVQTLEHRGERACPDFVKAFERKLITNERIRVVMERRARAQPGRARASPWEGRRGSKRTLPNP